MVNDLDQNFTVEHLWAHIRLSAKLKDTVHYWYECNLILYSAWLLYNWPVGLEVSLCVFVNTVWTYDVESQCHHHLPFVKWNPFFFLYARQYNRSVWDTVIKILTWPWMVTEWAISQIASSLLLLELTLQVLDLVEVVFELNVLCK